jgi:hypothetical protein
MVEPATERKAPCAAPTTTSYDANYTRLRQHYPEAVGGRGRRNTRYTADNVLPVLFLCIRDATRFPNSVCP